VMTFPYHSTRIHAYFFSREQKMAEFRSAAEADPEIAAWGKKVATTFGLVSQ
jgi:hypothetical protein